MEIQSHDATEYLRITGAVTPLLTRMGPAFAPADSASPIPDYGAMEILTLVVIIAGALYLRARLSVEKIQADSST